MQQALELGLIDSLVAGAIQDLIQKNTTWLIAKILHGSYKTHDDDDPTMSFIFDSVIKHKNIQVTFDTARECDRVKKSISQNLGNFWQKMLGGAPGWRDLTVGDASGCDIVNDEKRIYIEVKNKYNTMNSSSEESTINKLLRQKEKGYSAYVGIVNDKKQRRGRKTKNGIEWVCGRELFRIVYGADVMNVIMCEVNKTITALLEPTHESSSRALVLNI